MVPNSILNYRFLFWTNPPITRIKIIQGNPNKKVPNIMGRRERGPQGTKVESEEPKESIPSTY